MLWQELKLVGNFFRARIASLEPVGPQALVTLARSRRNLTTSRTGPTSSPGFINRYLQTQIGTQNVRGEEQRDLSANEAK